MWPAPVDTRLSDLVLCSNSIGLRYPMNACPSVLSGYDPNDAAAHRVCRVAKSPSPSVTSCIFGEILLYPPAAVLRSDRSPGSSRTLAQALRCHDCACCAAVSARHRNHPSAGEVRQTDLPTKLIGFTESFRSSAMIRLVAVGSQAAVGVWHALLGPLLLPLNSVTSEPPSWTRIEQRGFQARVDRRVAVHSPQPAS
jgi:hypothetical protein